MADQPDVLKRLEEQLADAQHDIWSHWMRWFFENDIDENRERWRRQMTTPYSGLSEREKESDRKVVREFMQPALCLTRALLDSQGELLPLAQDAEQYYNNRMGDCACYRSCKHCESWDKKQRAAREVIARAELVRRGEV